MATTRLALARAVSIAGHPLVLLLAAAMIVASTGGASFRQMRFIAVAMVVLSAIAIGFSWYKVRAGHWSHIDASVRSERNSLNIFLSVLLLLSAPVVWMLTQRPHMAVAMALSGVLFVIALLIARWVKVSLHAAFAAFSTALVWPIAAAFIAGVAVTSAVVWSRLVLGRHVAADVVAGLLLGAAAGGGYQLWSANT